MPRSRPRAATALPALLFGLALAGAAAVAARGGAAPAATLFRRVVEHHRALYEGDVPAAAAPAAGPGVAVGLRERVLRWRGAPWVVRALDVEDPGDGARVVVLRASGTRGVAVAEEEIWRRSPDGTWRLEHVAAPGP